MRRTLDAGEHPAKRQKAFHVQTISSPSGPIGVPVTDFSPQIAVEAASHDSLMVDAHFNHFSPVQPVSPDLPNGVVSSSYTISGIGQLFSPLYCGLRGTKLSLILHLPLKLSGLCLILVQRLICLHTDPLGMATDSPARPVVATISGIELEAPDGANSSDPFGDCVGSFGTFTPSPFPFPANGQVDGYIKFQTPNSSSRSAQQEKNTSRVHPVGENPITHQTLVKRHDVSKLNDSSLAAGLSPSSALTTHKSHDGGFNAVALLASGESTSLVLKRKFISEAMRRGDPPARIPAQFGMAIPQYLNEREKLLWRFCKWRHTPRSPCNTGIRCAWL